MSQNNFSTVGMVFVRRRSQIVATFAQSVPTLKSAGATIAYGDMIDVSEYNEMVINIVNSNANIGGTIAGLVFNVQMYEPNNDSTKGPLLASAVWGNIPLVLNGTAIASGSQSVPSSSPQASSSVPAVILATYVVTGAFGDFLRFGLGCTTAGTTHDGNLNVVVHMKG